MLKKSWLETTEKSQDNQMDTKNSDRFFRPFFDTLKSNHTNIKLRTIAFWLAIGIIVANSLSLLFPLTLLQIYDRVIPNKAIPTLLVLSIVVVAAVCCEVILRTCISKINQWLDAKFEYQYGIANIKKIMGLSVQEYVSQGIGFYLEKLEQLEKLRNFYAGQALSSILNTPFIIIFLLLIMQIGGILVLAPITVILVIGILLYYFTPQLDSAYEAKLDNNIKISNFTINTLDSIHYIKSQALESQMLRRYEKLCEKKLELNTSEWKRHILQLIRLMGGQCMMIVVAILGAPLVVHNQLSIGGLAACIIISNRCVQPLNTIAQVWIQLQTVIRAKKTIDNAFKDHEDLSYQDITIRKPIEIKFENVSIIQHDETVLQNINLQIHQGTCIAIEGEKGIVKSRLLKALLNDFSLENGKILINDIPINQIPPKKLAAIFSYISKESALYNASIMENLTEFHKNREQVVTKIAEQVGLLSFINKLPKGIDTELTPQVISQIPRGIKQLIGITKGLARPAEIILFDEANAYLSISSDQKVINLLKKFKRNKTIIITSQRKSLNNIADKKYKISNNRLLEVYHA